MDKEQLIFTMFKDERFTGRNHLKELIKKQFKDVTDEQLKDITLKIYNYQVDKYGETLIKSTSIRTVEDLKKINRQAKQRKYEKKKYYQKQGRM